MFFILNAPQKIVDEMSRFFAFMLCQGNASCSEYDPFYGTIEYNGGTTPFTYYIGPRNFLYNTWRDNRNANVTGVELYCGIAQHKNLVTYEYQGQVVLKFYDYIYDIGPFFLYAGGSDFSSYYTNKYHIGDNITFNFSLHNYYTFPLSAGDPTGYMSGASVSYFYPLIDHQPMYYHLAFSSSTSDKSLHLDKTNGTPQIHWRQYTVPFNLQSSCPEPQAFTMGTVTMSKLSLQNSIPSTGQPGYEAIIGFESSSYFYTEGNKYPACTGVTGGTDDAVELYTSYNFMANGIGIFGQYISSLDRSITTQVIDIVGNNDGGILSSMDFGKIMPSPTSDCFKHLRVEFPGGPSITAAGDIYKALETLGVL